MSDQYWGQESVHRHHNVNENSLSLGNFSRGRPIHVVLRRLQKGQTTQTGRDSVQTKNKLPSAETSHSQRQL